MSRVAGSFVCTDFLEPHFLEEARISSVVIRIHLCLSAQLSHTAAIHFLIIVCSSPVPAWSTSMTVRPAAARVVSVRARLFFSLQFSCGPDAPSCLPVYPFSSVKCNPIRPNATVIVRFGPPPCCAAYVSTTCWWMNSGSCFATV